MKLEELEPVIVDKIWGGQKVSHLKSLSSQRIGETWEVSTHPEGVSKLSDGTLLNSKLNLSYLVKFIDTSDHLSVQVHPGDEYAQEYEGQKGKCESWLILDAQEGAGIYLGFKPGVDKNLLKSAIEQNDNISELLNFIPVSKGDFFYLPYGAVHAIGHGVTLVEAQQSSGVTYRVWDWNRLGLDGRPRELHLSKALDVLNFDDQFNEKLLDYYNIFHDSRTKLVSHEDFKVEKLIVNSEPIECHFSKGDALVVLDQSIQSKFQDFLNFKSYMCLEAGSLQLFSKEPAIALKVSE